MKTFFARKPEKSKKARDDKHVALVAGASGITGRALMTYLASRPREQVPLILGLSRHRPGDTLHPQVVDRVKYLEYDLLNDDHVQALGKNPDLEHVDIAFFCAYAEQANEDENIRVNGGMFRSFLDAVTRRCGKLRHVVLQTGAKYYGCHLGPYKTPSDDDDPPHEGKNFYFVQEEYLAKKCEEDGNRWTYSIVRPLDIIGFALGNFMSEGPSIAAYAVLMKEMGQKLTFPGAEELWETVYDSSDVNIVARLHYFLAAHSCRDEGHADNACKNKPYNVKNGDVFRWKYLWPKIAEYFDMEWEGPQYKYDERPEGGWFAKKMEEMDSGNRWKDVAEKHHLKEKDVFKLITPSFIDMSFCRNWSVFQNMNRARKMGFKDYIATEDSFFRLFDQMRDHGYLPTDVGMHKKEKSGGEPVVIKEE